MKAAGLTEEPPVVIRNACHGRDRRHAGCTRGYSNLCTESKYNGESLTTWEPRGKQQAIHLEMSKLVYAPGQHPHSRQSRNHPVRRGSGSSEMRVAARDRLGAKGVHLYPLSYWNWPDSPDIADSAAQTMETRLDLVRSVGAVLVESGHSEAETGPTGFRG